MKTIKISLLVFACFLCNQVFSQQITVDNTLTEQQLIENTLTEGCVEITNINSQVNGSVNGFGSFGYFESASSNFPFENGIILSTGNAASAGNTQNNDILNEGEDNWLTDTDLETALGISGTLNATSIEFDFISISNQVQFNYILASEEYFGNFPCEYSDGFAFLIREAGTNDPYTNIAVIPGTSTPVNTNTIHDEIAGFCAAENEEYFEGYSIGDTNYNGRTAVMTATATITPYVQYHIKMIIADQTDENYDSAVFIEGNSFDAVVDLGEDISTCAESLTLNGDIQNAQATYSWYLNNTLINGETQPELHVTQSGTYTVQIEIPISNTTCIMEDSVDISLSSTQSADPISDYEICDDLSGDGIETFDLSTKDAEVLASVPNSTYNYSYHLTNDDAINNTNAITTPIQNTSNPQAIFVRIEDVNNGCLAFSTFNLIVNELPNITAPTDLDVCDDDTADGLTLIDLSEKDDEITSGQTILDVTYHFTQADADSGANPIALPYSNTSQTEQLFVRVTNSQTGCASTTTLTFNVLDNPVINTEDLYIDACDPEHDGFATFDLNTITDEVLNGITGVSTSFHETYEDALTLSNPIANPTSYDNTTFEEQTLYISVVDDVSGCISVAPFEIHANLLLTGTTIRNFSLCDQDNDGEEAFDLENIAISIINDIPNVTVSFYETESDRDNQINEIDVTVAYVPNEIPHTLYIALHSDTCTEYEDIELNLNPIIEFDTIGSVNYCDDDQDGFTLVDLSIFDSMVTEGQSGFTVMYYESESDANSNTNALPTMYNNISNPQILYTRIRYDQTGCADVNSFELNIIPAPITATPTDVIICDDNQDGIYTIDLNSKISELVSDTANRTFSFHTSLSDAEASANAITNPLAYPSNTQTIFARVENATTGCHTIESFEVIVNTLPTFINISNYSICEQNSDGFGDFTFNTKDAEILNGQAGKEVLYFESQNDADNRTNAIDKTVAYQNLSNPQTIFVRVENTTDQDCYGTASFTIEMGSNPEFNAPTDWFVCDDISNDGSEVFDLYEKITEISQGIPESLDITFYTSLVDSENGTNPIALNYANTSNPQTIYVRIDNGTICNSLTAFEVNVIPAPEASPSEPLVSCDVDYDGIVTFDLTDAEVDIFDVRQDDIVIAYYETLNDLENETNPIADPENYNNISNPQTVYVRITNTVSNCYLGLPLELIVNLPPTINDFESVSICDNVDSYYNLNEVNALVTSETDAVITYYLNANDALTANNVIATDYTYQTNNDTIHVRIENNTTGCFTTYAFQLEVNPLPVAYQPSDLEDCDDDFDGFLTFDISQQNATILGTQSPNNFTVTYHNSETDVNTGDNNLPDLYDAIDGEIIYVRVENNTTGCYITTQFTTHVYARPIVDIDDQTLCLNNSPLYVTAETNNPGDEYIWSTNQTTPDIEITEIGSYWVTVITPFGCSTTSEFEVIESETAIIEFTETLDFSDPNSITVNVSGIGDYLYILDNGVPQESNFFNNVTLGYHTITVMDINGCAEATREVVVVDAPKFFTPNNDGYFDTWHISGIETLPGSIVYIYDRYGKLIKQLTSNSAGWNGFYNGNRMPTSDYWFVAKIISDDGEFEVKGHFTLKI
ncbi:T9SS type B sorting domain-containing protein [Meridianimaribacter flavus]|uniref:Gliding motility-associated-like protein n=1 Tax=Meridianimaribacter flavus TaxID=571115 RepID=A0ABY2G5N4_9FLAO|nr:choice-of-anchor L domain-containing protein [Meridianimaribacter flavus]TDY11577.1 gliding motility-associated-like protein [Meridianimaribacter flavus]